MLLGRLPSLATVGIGSLPFIDERAAVRHATRAYDVPFCPQLPALDGDMIDEWLGADPARCGWTPDRDRPEPRAWTAFTAAVADRPPPHGIVKLQVTGPLTLAAGLQRASGATAFGRSTTELAAELAAWLAGNAAGQIQALRDLGLDTLLVVDEPGLAHLSATARDVAVWDPLRAVASAWGLHVCGPVPWRLVEIAEPDLISYDLVRYGIEVEAGHVLARHLDRGGRVAFGAIDATAPPGPTAIVGRVKAPLVTIARILGRPLPALAASMLLSPSCGTGRLSGQRERLVAAELGAASMLLRDFVDSPRAAELHRPQFRPQSTGTP
ncbi:MAG: hypothetical protein AAGC46_09385 [Solirubrobacteraceae bacterium]|nr:hypothetical protein [Patulibacter sp.]